MADKVDIELEGGKGITFHAGADANDRVVIEHFGLGADDATVLTALIKSGEALTVTIKEKG